MSESAVPEDVNVPPADDVTADDVASGDEIMPVEEAMLIMLMRIYDVNMAQLAADYPERAAALLEKHQKGRILGPLPSISMD